MSVVVDATKLKKALSAFAGGTKDAASQEMRIQARNLGVQLAFATQPFGDSKEVKERAEKRVQTEIQRVYKPTWVANRIIGSSGLPSKSMTQSPRQAAAAYSALVNGAMESRGKRKYKGLVDADLLLQRLNVNPLIYTTTGKFDGGTHHKNARYGATKRVPKNQYVKTVVTDANILDKYVDKKMANVGVAKSGWAMAAMMISLSGGIGAGTRGIPGWVTRQIKKYDTGTADDKSDRDLNPFVKLYNQVKYIGQCISQRTIQKTVDIQVSKMVKRMMYILKAEAKKAGL